MRDAPFLLIDISNSFTKIARADWRQIGEVRRIPTPELTAARIRSAAGGGGGLLAAIVSSVVPSRLDAVRAAAEMFASPSTPVTPIVEISHSVDLGIGIRYPSPSKIGADRLANSVAAAELYGVPSVVIDFGTAVTFDVVSRDKEYLGGVIAPGLNAMTSYLHEKTALLPRVRLSEPTRTVGKSTREAMLSGAVYGYRGLISEILRRIRKEAFGGARCRVIATGGDAVLIAGGLPLFHHVNPLLTLHGLRIIAARHFPETGTGPSPVISFANLQRGVAIDVPCLRRAALAAMPRVLRERPSGQGVLDGLREISVAILGDAAMGDAHMRFLGDASPTDVITFPYGEILLGAETIARNARRFGQSTMREATRCLIHGLLHLHGFDDRTIPQRDEMFAAQERILASITP